MKLSTKIILPIILISALLILLNGCFGVPTDEEPGYTPGTITGIIAAPCCSTSAESVSEPCCVSPEYWCYYCAKEWKLQNSVKVVLTYGEDEVATTTTNENGEFTFTDVSPGKNYVITAYCPDYDDDRPLVKDVALELVEGGYFDTKITDLVSTSLGLVVDFLVDFTILGPEDIVLDEVIADKPDFPNFPKFKNLIYEVRIVGEKCEDLTTDDDVQYALCLAAEEISGLTIGCGPGYTPPPVVKRYTVTYNGNGNTGGTAPIDASSPYVKGATVTVLGQGSLVRTGYTFDGWNTAAGGTGTDRAAGDTFSMGTADVTLYAKWNANNYHITFDKNDVDAVGTMADQTIASGSSANLIPNAFSKEGWTFMGWAETPTGAVAYADQASYLMGTADVTLYAKWNAIGYTLTINYMYEGDGQAAPPHVETLNMGSLYSVDSPLIAEYTADRLNVSGTMPADDVTETVTYVLNPCCDLDTHTVFYHLSLPNTQQTG